MESKTADAGSSSSSGAVALESKTGDSGSASSSEEADAADGAAGSSPVTMMDTTGLVTEEMQKEEDEAFELLDQTTKEQEAQDKDWVAKEQKASRTDMSQAGRHKRLEELLHKAQAYTGFIESQLGRQEESDEAAAGGKRKGSPRKSPGKVNTRRARGGGARCGEDEKRRHGPQYREKL